MKTAALKQWTVVSMLFLLGCESPPIETEQKMTPMTSVQVVGRKDLNVSRDPLRVVEAEIQDDRLMVTVEYSGGSEEHEFDLFCSRALAKSLPPKANLYLSHNANGDMAKAMVRKELVFDLKPMEELKADQVVIQLYSPGESKPYEKQLMYSR